MESESSRTRVHFGSPDDVRVAVTFNYYASVFALACDGVSDLVRRSTRSPAARVVESLPVAARRSLLPIVAPGHSLSPDCLSPASLTRDITLAEELDRLRSLTPDEIRADFERTFAAAGVPTHWRAAWEHPRRWIEGVTTAFEHIGRALEPTWLRSSGRREREAERIGGAVARGAVDVALAASHPRGTLRGLTLEFPDSDPVELSATGQRVVLTPMVGQPRLTPCNLDRPEALWFGYPLPPPSGESGAEASPEELDALLTPIRARLLRSLDRELPMHALPELLACSPATATHHCRQLAKSGLIQRRRQGRSITVARTPRGDLLLEAYETRAWVRAS